MHESAIKETGGIGNNMQTASIPNSKRRINYDFQFDDVLHVTTCQPSVVETIVKPYSTYNLREVKTDIIKTC